MRTYKIIIQTGKTSDLKFTVDGENGADAIKLLLTDWLVDLPEMNREHGSIKRIDVRQSIGE